MRLLDTSALVAALVSHHPRHTWARPHLEEPGAACCTHSLAELYAVLSASPQFRLSPSVAAQTVKELAARLVVVPVTPDLYLSAVQRLSTLSLGGGAVYDALIAEAALGANAGHLVTLNAKHFLRLGEDVASLVVEPND